MLTLFLVLAGLTAIALAAVVMSLALRRGEEQDRQTRHTDPHAAYWGRNDLPAPDTRPTPAHSRTRPQHRRPR
ncbi:hypothetical protein ACIGD1_11375 [Streptomyces sp. NPDC085612]|uniref:hypothetical protein n=1 Tax=Streptomyces sp. NPDC085612 TaxID=3365732 RepID=UPI0037D87E43